MPSTGEATARSKINYNIADLAETFLLQRAASGRSPHTLQMYKRVIDDLALFSGLQDIRLIQKEMIDRYADEILMRSSLGLKAKNYWLAQLKIFFAWAAGCGFILSDPSSHLKIFATKKRKFPPYLTQNEITRLLESIPTGTVEDLRDRALLELLYSSGLRGWEACKLTINDINFADGTIAILMSKGKKDRIVPVGKIALHYLDRYIGLRGLHPGSLFELAGWQLRKIVRSHAKTSGIKKKCVPHTFRHSCAIHMLECGASIRHIQAMLGHADLRTTQRYTNIVPAELKRAHLNAHPSEHRRGRLPSAKPRHVHMFYSKPAV